MPKLEAPGTLDADQDPLVAPFDLRGKGFTPGAQIFLQLSGGKAARVRASEDGSFLVLMDSVGPGLQEIRAFARVMGLGGINRLELCDSIVVIVNVG